MAQVNGSVSHSGAGEPKRVEDLDVRFDRGALENSQNDIVDRCG